MTRRNKSYLKNKAINYRKNGYSYRMISEKYGVAKSTLSGWLKDIPYKPNVFVKKRIKNSHKKSVLALKKKRLLVEMRIKQHAIQEVGILDKRDLLMLGIGLYIGEGSKNRRGTIRIVNSDPMVINLAITWFKNLCNLTNENFRLRVHAYPDNNIEETIKYWSKITNINKNQFLKTYIDKRKNKILKYGRKLTHGTAHLTVISNGNKNLGVNLFRRIMELIEAVENHKMRV